MKNKIEKKSLKKKIQNPNQEIEEKYKLFHDDVFLANITWLGITPKDERCEYVLFLQCL